MHKIWTCANPNPTQNLNFIESKRHQVILEGSSTTLTFYPSAGSRAHLPFSAAMRPCWSNCSRSGGDVDECMTKNCFPRAVEADEKVAREHGFDRLRDQHVPLLMRAVYGDK